MTQAIERAASSRLALELWGAERLQVLKEQIAPGASDAELDLFATVCKRTGLDPFARQIWSIQRKQWNGKLQREEWHQVIQFGVHGLRLIAQRSREYAGQRGPLWCANDGQWVELWLSDEHPAAAKVGVLRKGFAEPVWAVAVWDRAKQTIDTKGTLGPLWRTRGPEMLALAAERDALRRAFPLETADVEVVVDESEVAAHAARYTQIFGDDEHGTSYDLPPARVANASGDIIDVGTGEVLEEAQSQILCVSCKQPIVDQIGKPINDNQRKLLLERFGKLECRACREL